MLKLNEKQLEQAYRLALQIGRCEVVKDEDGPAKLQAGILVTEIPVHRDVVIAAANAEIARCHSELKALGIDLAPRPPIEKFAVGGHVMNTMCRAAFVPIDTRSILDQRSTVETMNNISVNPISREIWRMRR